MVNVATSPPMGPSTRALATAGQFRAISLWLNQSLIPQGIYIQVQPDKRPGCLLIIAEFDQAPEPQRLTQYICHLIWQLNSPVIEGIHIIGRPVGQSKLLWENRIRVMTPALRQRLQHQRGHRQTAATMPPAIAHQPPQRSPSALGSHHLKTLRAFMLTGSAVAAFVFGCLADVLLVPRQEPSLPFQQHQSSPADAQIQTSEPSPHPQPTDETLLLTHRETGSIVGHRKHATSITYPHQTAQERPHVVNGALEPVGVIHHQRLLQPNDPTVTLVFGGDVSFNDLPPNHYEQHEHLLSNIAAYQHADVAMVNLDDSLATAATSLEEEWLNRQRPELVNLLKAGGVDIVNLTSDKLLSFGEQGLAETLETLDRSGIYRVGAGRDEREARRPEILDVKGQRIAYLSYDRTGNQSAHAKIGGVNAPGKQAIIEDIQAIRDDVDWLVVNYRWNHTIPEKPADFQTNLARLAIDQGADLVVGYHPTQLQGAEIYKGRPIAYSLGDFVFGKSATDALSESAVLQVSLRDRQMKVDLIPVKIHDGQPQRVSNTEAATILDKIQAASQEFDLPMAPSVVLDAHPVHPPTQAEPVDALESNVPESDTPDSFVEDIPGEVPGVPAGNTVDSPAPDAMNQHPLHGPDHVTPTLDIEIAPIPEGLLDNWGPKTGTQPELKPGTDPLFNPADAPLERIPPAVQPGDAAVSADEDPDKHEGSASNPTDAAPDISDSPAGAIAPYSEPLVGPLSAVPGSPLTAVSETADRSAVTSPVIQEPLAFSPARILKPQQMLSAIDAESANAEKGFKLAPGTQSIADMDSK